MKRPTFKTTGKPEVTYEVDYRYLRIYINNVLHLIIPRSGTHDDKNSFMLQSYYVGSKKGRRYIIEWSNGNFSDYMGYSNIELWKEVLRILDENA